MKQKWVVLPALALMIGISPAFAEDHGGGMKGKGGGRSMSVEGLLEKLDANSDGIISKEEFISRHEQKFNEMDADSDGNVTKEEIASHHESMRAKHEDERKKREDEMFSKMDADGDGVISREEMAAGHETMRERMKERRKERFGHESDDDQPEDGAGEEE